jgi:hypothetical protein
MENPHCRYFIELQPQAGTDVPRYRENEVRRSLANDFISMMRDWLKENDLGRKVSGLSVTMFGQVQITCEPAVINLIRNQDVVNVAAIRQGVALADGMLR